MRFADVVATSATVAATGSRTAKRDAIAELLSGLAPDEVAPTVGFLVGSPRQGRTGVGWNTLAAVGATPAAEPSLTVGDVDRLIDQLPATTGVGSVGARRDLLRSLLDRATGPEADFFFQLMSGGLRQGALEGVMADAVAKAAGVPATVVRSQPQAFQRSA